MRTFELGLLLPRQEAESQPYPLWRVSLAPFDQRSWWQLLETMWASGVQAERRATNLTAREQSQYQALITPCCTPWAGPFIHSHGWGEHLAPQPESLFGKLKVATNRALRDYELPLPLFLGRNLTRCPSNSWKQPSSCLTREPTQSTEKLHCPFNSPMESGAWTENPYSGFPYQQSKTGGLSLHSDLVWAPQTKSHLALGPILVTSRTRKLIHSSPITEYSAQSLTRESRQLQSPSYGLTWPTAVLPTCSHPVTHISYPHF